MKLEHPSSFKEGIRELRLVGRKKDKTENRLITRRISFSQETFDAQLNELILLKKENERIYSSVSPRNLSKAIKTFRFAQLNAEYSNNIENFYKSLNSNWISALMAPENQEKKLWLFDCDTPEQYDVVLNDLLNHYSNGYIPYIYNTKNGIHIITEPFNIKN
jgi:hypothetical protein